MLLVGESADLESVASIRKLVEDDSAVLHAGPPLTMHLGPEEVLLNLHVQFRPGQSTEDLIEAVDRLERAIRKQHPKMRRIFLEIERLRHRDGRPIPVPRRDVDEPDQPTEPAAAGRTPADY
jgi:divalent metal cation (Fe/Co/Zn/Cd) transporter